MKHYDDEEQQPYKKRLKRAKNRPGEGMRLLNKTYEQEDFEDIDFDDELQYNYDTNTD